MGDSIKIDGILSKRAQQKEKSLSKKKFSLSNIKSVIGTDDESTDGASMLSRLLKINLENKDGSTDETFRKKKQKNDIEIVDDDDDDDQLKLLDHEKVCVFLKENIEPQILRYVKFNMASFCFYLTGVPY